ncbi:hypothetical protein TSUD_96900 [Trifolium subterraneum]|nr:hypothetical protein TSUD_96900 [Trifolium subterraneum]
MDTYVGSGGNIDISLRAMNKGALRHEVADAESTPMPLAMYALLGPPARWRSRSASRAPG